MGTRHSTTTTAFRAAFHYCSLTTEEAFGTSLRLIWKDLSLAFRFHLDQSVTSTLRLFDSFVVTPLGVVGNLVSLRILKVVLEVSLAFGYCIL